MGCAERPRGDIRRLWARQNTDAIGMGRECRPAHKPTNIDPNAARSHPPDDRRSEVYGAVCAGRRGVGIELKPSYYRQAVKNLATAEIGKRDGSQQRLFTDAPGAAACGA